jgi:hypothetical protein
MQASLSLDTITTPKMMKFLIMGDYFWRAPKSRGETHLRVSQSQIAEVETWRHAPGFQL